MEDIILKRRLRWTYWDQEAPSKLIGGRRFATMNMWLCHSHTRATIVALEPPSSCPLTFRHRLSCPSRCVSPLDCYRWSINLGRVFRKERDLEREKERARMRERLSEGETENFLDFQSYSILNLIYFSQNFRFYPIVFFFFFLMWDFTV